MKPNKSIMEAPEEGHRVNSNGQILCNSYEFRDEKGGIVRLLGKPYKGPDSDFIYFQSGSGRRYIIRQVLITRITETNIPFEVRT